MNQMRSLLISNAVLERLAATLADKFSGISSPQTICRYENESTARSAAPPDSNST
ncbi:hypothetical protein [Micromonospora endophytica]|uniref:hypothetical protein n=1 Tax=Micromonospora endophytica TaxID=515350 RepID=UPI0015E8D293|nr:hypothetical protein [Micromonospora endophytica]BCJ57043.1 hypothetical protein Jiend_04650 [Micromonospora endophytica]